MNELKIEYLPLSKLKPYKNNPKRHSKEQLERIKNSLEAFSSDWQKGDKDRTYIKIEESYQSGGKTRRTVDMGYFDNVTGKYYPGRAKDGDLSTPSVWNMSGSKKFSEAEIAEELKKRKK